MSYEFYDCFKSCDDRNNACNWTVLRNSDLSHLHRQWDKGKYIITMPGNRHLPNTPQLAAFTLEATFAVVNNGDEAPELKIYFWYDKLKRTGHFINCRFEDGRCTVFLGFEYGAAIQIIAEQRGTFDAREKAAPRTITLQVSRNLIEVRLENCPPFVFPLAEASKGSGRIGFDRGNFSGMLELHEVKINSTENICTKVLLPETEFIFPPGINGFHTPLRYKVSMRQFDDTTRVDLEISGSDAQNPDVPWFPYHGLIFEVLTAPYLRIGEQRLYPAAQDTLVLANPDPAKQDYFYSTLYRKPAWPLRASFFLAEISGIDTIGIGYEYCENEAGSKHLSGGPNEAVFDVASRSLVYVGAAVRKGIFILELHSQADKEICRQIPPADPRYEAAVAFAKRNHFFNDSEKCCFKVTIRCAETELSAEDVQLCCRLENAFTEELKSIALAPLEIANNTEAGFTELVVELPPFNLAAGVYHLYFELMFAGRNTLSQRHAFEVMPADPDAPAAPLLSGLPLLFSMPNETKGLEQDQFEPYLDVENNAAHYLSITTHYPDVGRKNQIYNILKLYHRKWFLWLTDRVAQHPGLEQNRDIISRCDFIQPPVTFNGSRCYEMWKPQTYQGQILQLLLDFLRSDAFHSGQEKHLTIANLEEIEREKAPFPESCIEELVAKHWMEWLNFFERWLVRENGALRKVLKDINPGIKRAGYGPMNIYAARGKTNHALRYRGTLPQFYDGFFVFEDYPFSCKYNIHRGPLLLATLKMANPDTQIYPEIYCSIKQGCPDGAVNYAWPPLGVTEHPASAEKKRFFEYAYAAVWFSQGEFHYWRDNGFHARAWPQEYFDVMLESWKFIHLARPFKPLRSTAYLYSDALCESHPAFYEYAKPNGYPWGDIFNTAEETIPYAWETARIDGQQSGFLCAPESLHEISPEDIALLVLPPLCGATAQQLGAIRSLHEQGVNLLAFENVEGLEDIFGVEPLGERVTINNIQVNTRLPDNPLIELKNLREYTEHPLCKAKYRAKGADVLLEGEAPVLLMNRTPGGRAALFNVPPTVVRRDSFYERVGYGRNSISELINRSVAMMQRQLGTPAVVTTAGKIVAFEAQNGERHIIVAEDAFPDEPTPISPLVTIRLRDIGNKQISCDKPFDKVFAADDAVKIRLQLDVHECAVITVSNP